MLLDRAHELHQAIASAGYGANGFGDFRDPATFFGLEPVDASILFEVLLHQENYSEVVRNVTNASTKFVCVAQPCLREEWFPLPASSTLLQFWDEELKDEIRRDSFGKALSRCAFPSEKISPCLPPRIPPPALSS